MKKLMTVCAVVGLIMATAGTAQAALDVDTIVMTSYKSHTDGTPDFYPWRFEVWVELDDSGSLDHIEVTKPGDLTPFTTIYEVDGNWEFESSGYLTIAALQGDYPTGEYTFDFYSDSSSLLTFNLDNSGLTEPTNPVNFTYPAYGATDVSLNPTFTWTIDSGAGDALGLWLDSDNDWYENIPVSMDTTSWEPLGPLNPNCTYDLEVSVINAKDLNGLAFPTMTVGSDEFKYGLWIEYLNGIEFTTIPEPASAAILALGMFALRRKHK
ncbi:MAG: hypothetical protein WC496_00975 [Phycisphaerae bacterium]|jgi:hypothetical protein